VKEESAICITPFYIFFALCHSPFQIAAFITNLQAACASFQCSIINSTDIHSHHTNHSPPPKKNQYHLLPPKLYVAMYVYIHSTSKCWYVFNTAYCIHFGSCNYSVLLHLQGCCYYWLQESKTYQVRMLSSGITYTSKYIKI
jgi:hypothetical protein